MVYQIKNVVVAGASGSLGGPILKVLLADGSFNISILSRSASNPSFPRGVKVHQTDYSVDSLVKAFEGQDAVVSAMGSTALDSQFAMVEAAAKAGVKRFLPSEMGINHLGPEMAAMPTIDVKHKVVDALKKRESQGLSWTGLFNGPFYDWGLQNGFLGFNVQEHTALLINGGTTSLRMTTLPSIGRAVAAILKKPDETANKYITVASFEASQQDVVKVLEKVTGQKFSVEKVTSDEKVRVGQEKLSKGDMRGIMDLIQGPVIGGLGRTEPLDNKLLGLAQEDLLEVTQKVLAGTYS